MQRLRSRGFLGAILVGLSAFVVGAAGYAQTGVGSVPSQAASPPVVTQTQSSFAHIVTSPAKTTVGNLVSFSATGFTPGSVIDLQWDTVEGGWVTRDYYKFEGKQYHESQLALGQFRVGDDGVLEGGFYVPEDYGGMHNVLALSDGTPVGQGAVEVAASFEMSPQEGPVGTPVEIHAKGLGWQTMESVWVLNWDNVAAGWISAAGTRGSAVARFRATGPVGDHPIKVYSGYMGQSYLNYEQAPNAYLERPDFVFHTTPGVVADEAFIEPYQPQPVPATESAIGATLTLSPTQGAVQTQTQLVGAAFPSGKTLSVVWQTMVGSRVSGTGFDPNEMSIGTIDVDTAGNLAQSITIPDDLGGLHALVLKDGDQELARAYFVIETSIVSMTPAAGPVGTEITIHLKGVGWTEYDNILVANYDNGYMGYVCGFNSQGDVVFHFTASGAPGTHLIDLYPGIYKGPADAPQQLYRLPQLTYADDHPGNKIPALRFAFTITD
jgi:hypothetical protein